MYDDLEQEDGGKEEEEEKEGGKEEEEDAEEEEEELEITSSPRPFKIIFSELLYDFSSSSSLLSSLSYMSALLPYFRL